MRIDHLTTLSRLLPSKFSRRGLLAGLVASALAIDPSQSEARRKGKKRRKKRNKKQDQPQTLADAQCVGSDGSAVAPAGDARVAQTFAAIRSGALVSAEVEIDKGSPIGDFFLQLAPVDAFGFPTNGVLADTFRASAQVPAGVSTVAFTFPQPATVVAGEQYALVLSRPGVGVTWRGRNDDGCAGAAFFSSDLTGPFQTSSQGFDLIFTTFVQG